MHSLGKNTAEDSLGNSNYSFYVYEFFRKEDKTLDVTTLTKLPANTTHTYAYRPDYPEDYGEKKCWTIIAYYTPITLWLGVQSSPIPDYRNIEKLFHGKIAVYE